MEGHYQSTVFGKHGHNIYLGSDAVPRDICYCQVWLVSDMLRITLISAYCRDTFCYDRAYDEKKHVARGLYI